MEKYEPLTDAELISLIRAGDGAAQDHLLEKYKRLVRLKSKTYYIAGADKEDIIQEGMIGLYKAVRDFKAERGVMFYSFAELCITRQIITAIKRAARKKHGPLNFSVSFGGETSVAAERALLGQSPEDLVLGREKRDYIEDCFDKVLSAMEYRVLGLFLENKSYSEIAEIIGRDEKSIGNALQRVRKKLEKVLADWSYKSEDRAGFFA